MVPLYYMGHCLKNGMEPNLQSIRKMHKRMHEIIPDVQAIVNMFQRNGAYSVEEIQNQNNFKAILNYCYYVKSVQNVEDILSYNDWISSLNKQVKQSSGCLIFLTIPILFLGFVIYNLV